MLKHLIAFALLARMMSAYGDSYELRFDPEEPSNLQIVAELTLSDPVLYSSHEGDDPGVWVGHISNLRAVDLATESPIEVVKCGVLGVLLCRPKYDGCNLTSPVTCPGFRPGGGKWKLKAKPGSRVRLSYDVDMNFADQDIPGGIDSAPYRTTNGQYFVGRAVFLANGTYDKQKKITVSFAGAEFGAILTPWQETTARQFEAQSNADLLDGIGFWGDTNERLIQEQGLTLKLAAPGVAGKLVAKELSSTLSKVVARYFEVAGTAPKDAENPIALIATVSDAWPSDGEVIGRNISLILNSDDGRVDWVRASFVFAHEVFHLWNSQTIAPASANMEWFREGMTDFFAFQALTRSQSIDRDELASMYRREFFTRYESDPARGQLSILEAGNSKEENWGIVYVGGFYVGMLMEEGLRKNGHSAEEVFQALIKRGNAYTLNSVLDAIEDLSPETRMAVEQTLRQPALALDWDVFQKQLDSLQ